MGTMWARITFSSGVYSICKPCQGLRGGGLGRHRHSSILIDVGHVKPLEKENNHKVVLT